MTTKKYHHGDLKNALIKAGMEILSSEGVSGLSLRKVAQKAGVSHAAPYAHFEDKQALIAAISTEGYRKLLDHLDAILVQYPNDPKSQLVEAAWAYICFAQTDPAHFRVTFSSAVEHEKNYPTLVEMTGKTFSRVVQIVGACQAAGLLSPGPADVMAISVWSMVHGFTSLLIEGQISHKQLERMTVREMLLFTLDQLMLNKLDPLEFSEIH
jgi:AcrR family transcriptional regulator